MKKRNKIILCSIIAISVATPVVGFFAVIGGMNVAKFVIYNEYYSSRTKLCKNPGLNDNFICQGIAISEKDEKILVSGYMTNKTASRVYITDLASNSYYVSLSKDGLDFNGHVGGIAITGDNVFLADANKIYTIDLDDFLSSKNGDIVEIGSGIEVNNAASFVFSNDDYIYVGEFHNGAKYITNHPYETNDGMYYAIISRYDVDDLSKPNKVYSIRNKVQGACFTDDGRVILSTSYGLSDSIYYIYNENECTLSSNVLDEAPVYYLDNCIKQIKGPAMGEDLDYYNNCVITLTESASNKYIFGKFFFANKIISLSI